MQKAKSEGLMTDLTFQQMLAMQHELWDKNKDSWSPLEPQFARNQFLWMIGEIGEALDIIKKCGEEVIMNDPDIKSAFTEELSDILMYFNDILLRYKILPKDIAEAYIKKYNKNMKRDYTAQHNDLTNALKSQYKSKKN